MKGSRLNYNAAIQAKYNKQLQALVAQMTEQTERQIKKLFNGELAEEYFAEDASISSQARILTNKLLATFNALFNKKAKPLATGMVSKTDKASKVSLKISVKEILGGEALKGDIASTELEESINAAVWENVQLIKTISNQYLSGIQGQVMRSLQQGGNGLADLLPYMKEHKEITKRRARMIAYDQTRKAFNNINSIRMQANGIKKFEWIHSGGGSHPRKEHIAMSGNVYRFDNLPVIGVMYNKEVRGIPGQLPNCGCTMAPVIELENENSADAKN